MANVLVTGGSRGLGLGIARQLAASGFSVIVVARRPTDQLAEAIEAAARAAAGSIAFRACDLADLAGLPDLVRRLRAEHGPIFGLVNNAASGAAGILATTADAQIEAQVRLNLMMPLLLTKYVVRSMLAQGQGRIVNIASVVAATGYGGLSVYGATKASLVGFTRSLAREVGPLGITVNAVSPGFIDTEMTHGLGAAERDRIMRRSALRRMAEVTDVAGMVDYLFSDRARNITGTVMTVDAGNTA